MNFLGQLEKDNIKQCKWVYRHSYNRDAWCSQCKAIVVIHPENHKEIYLYSNSTWSWEARECERSR